MRIIRGVGLLVGVMLCGSADGQPPAQVSQRSSFAERMISAFEAGERSRLLQERVKRERAEAEYYRQLAESAKAQRQQQQRRELTAAEIRQIDAEIAQSLKQFSEKYPDWTQYEPTMLEFGAKVLPARGVSDIEYLEVLYMLATRPRIEKALGDTNKRIADYEIERFRSKHADWKDYEVEMTEASKQIKPADDAGLESYLEALYVIAKAAKSAR